MSWLQGALVFLVGTWVGMLLMAVLAMAGKDQD
jgi:purine-cytosine permease-like protein